jgi:membrane-bound inhibitor of C-type lysozyme
MSASLLDLVDELIEPELLTASARGLGIGVDATRAALNASFASILAGLAATAGNALSIEAAFDIVNDPDNDHPPQDGLGRRLLSHLFGPQRSPLGDLIGRSAGLPGGGAAALSLAAPLVLGVLRRKIVSTGLNPLSLSRLLRAERDEILRAAPAGVDSLAGAAMGMAEVPGAERERGMATRQTSPARMWHAVVAVVLAGSAAFFTREPPADFEETGMVGGVGGEILPFACGSRQVEVAPGHEGAILTAGTQVFELHRTQTSSGARYEAAGEPPKTVFWHQGGLATVVVDGDTYPQCRRVR